MSILDISKMSIYDFYYNIMENKYYEKVILLYMETDSLIMDMKTKDIYDDVKNIVKEFHTSDYPEDNVYGIPVVNKKVLGKFKDELNGKIMEDFIGLRSKLYAHKMFENGKESKNLKA
jgi:hypothetical protein